MANTSVSLKKLVQNLLEIHKVQIRHLGNKCDILEEANSAP